jgi:hypothetical protein
MKNQKDFGKKQAPCQRDPMGDRGKPINFGDPMYAATWAGRVWVHVTLREVSRSPAAFEEGLRMSVSTGR